MIRTIALLLAATFTSPTIALPGDVPPEAHPLTLSARVWGLIKYYHPAVTACEVDWDQALLDRVADLENAADPALRESVLADLIAAAGPTPETPLHADTPPWISAAPLDDALKRQLAWTADQRPNQQCYVTPQPGTGQANFDSDSAHASAAATREMRALAAFRYWNAIEYFFPYKTDIGRPWSWALDETLQAILDADTTRDYVLATRALTAAIEDSHAFLQHPPIFPPGAGLPPFSVAAIEGRAIVTHAFPEASPVQPGDALLTVDGLSVAEDRAQIEALMFGSNPAFRERLTLTNVLAGTPDPGVFRLRRPDGAEYEVTVPRGATPAGPLEGQPVWQEQVLDGCSMGIIDLTRLQPAQVEQALDALHHTDALVFDVRGYPAGTLWPIVDRLYTEPRSVAHFTRPVLEQPGLWRQHLEPIGGRTPAPYNGTILVLQDERAISQSEYTVMGLQAIGRTLVFGSQTAGADGNITTIQLPGDIRATFTGLGVYYPDGRATQRIGIVPDVHVRPTVQGLAAGRDEVLEAALDCRWLSESPALRLPPTGLYFAAERSGEGVDVHRSPEVVAALSYGYDEAGAPIWLLSTGSSDDTQWGEQFQRYGDLGATPAMAAVYAVDFHAGPYAPACATADQNDLLPRARWRWPDAEGAPLENCLLPLLLSGQGAATGLWTGPPEETGWGVSVHQLEDHVWVVVYAYDDAGNPRWLIGDGSMLDGVAEIPLQRAQGFCRSCAPAPVTLTPAGLLRLHLPSGADDNRLDIDAEFAPGARWQRTRMPLFRLTAGDPP